MRLILLFILVCLLLGLPFVFWGDWFETFLSGERAVEWLQSYGSTAWIVAVLLLLLDIVLPIPATGVFAALGIIYGALAGGLIATLGSFLAGMTGYLLSRWLGRGAAMWIAGEKDLTRCEQFFSSRGGIAVIVSRWLPILPEAVSCLAGLARMKFSHFSIALLLSSAPISFLFAFLGEQNASRPVFTLILAVLLPLAFWLPLWYFVLKKKKQT